MNLFQKKIHVPTENLSSLIQQRCSAVGWDRRAQKRFLFYEFICIFVIIVFLFGEDAFRQWFSLVRNFLYLINWEQFPGHGLGIIFKWNMPEIACDKQLFGPSLCWRIWGVLKSWDYFFFLPNTDKIPVPLYAQYWLCMAESAKKDTGSCWWVLSCLNVRSTLEARSVFAALCCRLVLCT